MDGNELSYFSRVNDDDDPLDARLRYQVHDSEMRAPDLVGAVMAVRAVVAVNTIQVPWTTDGSAGFTGEGVYGPDGPWQALDIGVGNYSSSNSNFGEIVNTAPNAMWPSGVGLSMVLTRAAGGNYTAENSSTAVVTNSRLGESDGWFSSMAMNESSIGQGVMDIVSIPASLGRGVSRINTSFVAMEEWAFGLPDGSNYSAQVGILGLGTNTGAGPQAARNLPGILQQLKADGQVASMSFGLHMGSVALRQPGSLVLGGYEQNRALGPVGVTIYDPTTIPNFFLVDMFLGTQLGGSAFGFTERERSVWQGLGNNLRGPDITKSLGGKAGSAVVVPNPAAPYLYLPVGNCEAAARLLPVSWNEKLGLFLWDKTKPEYQRIMRYPTYLSLILSDRTATNITIKVPMQLLNLTLERPLVDAPTSYFPCKPLDSAYGFWILGRAFLQAAFLGLNLEQNLTYIAQAPGPNMEQSVVRTLQPSDAVPQSNSIEEFERSWNSSWVILEQTGDTPESELGPASQSAGLSTGALVGIVIAAVIVLVTVVAIAVWYWRRQKVDRPKEASVSDSKEDWTTSDTGAREMEAEREVHEIGKPLAHEMEVREVPHEAPSEPQYFELSAENNRKRT